jgi:predicted RNA-binding Zn ribbon-like protein
MPDTAPPDLCIEFANTRWWRGAPQPTESLNAPADVLAWAANNGVSRSKELADRWARRPAEAESEFALVMALREAMYRLFAAIAGGHKPAPADLALLNKALAEAPVRGPIEFGPGGFSWRSPAVAADAHALLARVLWSAGDLLASRRLERLRCCANPLCQYLFVDESRSGTRRWCSMATCGNRAKAHRHYARSKAKGASKGAGDARSAETTKGAARPPSESPAGPED